MANLKEWQRRVALDIAQAFPLTPAVRIKASGNHLIAAQDEPEPCADDMHLAELSHGELQDIDATYHQLKVSGGLRRRDDDSALADQVQHLRNLGGL